MCPGSGKDKVMMETAEVQGMREPWETELCGLGRSFVQLASQPASQQSFTELWLWWFWTCIQLH